jgi:hypothetical protein
MHIQREHLLSVEKDAKTRKGAKNGVLTGVLYLAPHDVSGFQVCPNATAGCIESCLFTAGRGIMSNVMAGRINRTRWFFEDRDSFMRVIVRDIEKLIVRARNAGMTPAVRLNGTSDIAWEKIRCERAGESFRNVMLAFPDIQFYDYTKILGRKSALMLDNYHLTFSMAENNDADAFVALEQGYNVAVVMDLKRNDVKPETWAGYPVIDGDKDDIRFFDPDGGHIVALHAKGKARYDQSGFVRSAIIAKG